MYKTCDISSYDMVLINEINCMEKKLVIMLQKTFLKLKSTYPLISVIFLKKFSSKLRFLKP